MTLPWYGVLGGFLVFFLLLFLQFPLSGSLPGDIDTWLYLSWFNDAPQRLASFFSGNVDYVFSYPLAQSYLFGEPSFASVAIYSFIKLFVFSDLWAYYLFMVLIFATNAWATFVVAKSLKLNNYGALLAAFILSTCNFTLAQIDNQNAIVFAPMLLGFSLLIKYLDEKQAKYLFLLAFLGGLQIYFSTYIFIFIAVVTALWLLINWKVWFSKKQLITVFGVAILSLLLVSPYLYWYILGSATAEPDNLEIKLKSLEFLSLEPMHFLQPLKNNLLYSRIADSKNYYGLSFSAASIGILVYVLAFIGLFYKTKYRKALVATWLLGFFVAIGPYIYWGDTKIPMPLYVVTYLFQKLILVNHVARFYAISVLVVAIFAGLGLQVLQAKLKLKPAILFVLVVGFFLLENIPVPFEKYESEKYFKASDDYNQWMQEVAGSTVLNLPSGPAQDNLEEYAAFGKREYIYEYWQLPFDVNVANGFGRPPEHFKTFRDRAAHIDEDGNLDSIMQYVDIDWIAYHPGMLLQGKETDVSEFLLQSDKLQLVSSSENLLVFKVLPKE